MRRRALLMLTLATLLLLGSGAPGGVFVARADQEPAQKLKLVGRKQTFPSGRLRRVYAGYYKPDPKSKNKQVFVRHGLDIYYYDADGKPRARVMSYQHDVPNGEMKQWSQNGVLILEGTYVDGKRDGIFKKYYADGRLMAEIGYKEDQKSGATTIYDGAGKRRTVMTYSEDKLHGPAVQYYDDGSIQLQVSYYKGHKDGKEVAFLPGHLRDREINWYRGKQHGDEIYWHPVTQNISFHFRWQKGEKGKPAEKDGAWQEFFPDGKPRTFVTYRNGMLQGKFTIYEEDGTLMSDGEYRDNKPYSGVFRQYADEPGFMFVYTFEAGKVKDGILLKEGQPYTGELVEWWIPGHRHRSMSFKDGRLNGLETEWSYDGERITEIHWNSNVLDGLFTQWYADSKGQKMREVSLQNGKREGPETIWTERGIVVSHGLYRNGTPWKGFLPRVFKLKDGSDFWTVQNYNNGQLVDFTFKHPDLQPPEAADALTEAQAADPNSITGRGPKLPGFNKPKITQDIGPDEAVIDKWVDEPVDPK